MRDAPFTGISLNRHTAHILHTYVTPRGENVMIMKIIIFVNYYFISISFSITVVSLVFQIFLHFNFISVYETIFSSIVFVLVYENNLG